MLRAKCTLFLQHIYTLNEVDKNNGKQKSHFFRWNVHIPQAHIKRICYTHRCKDVAMDSCLRSATQKTPNRNKTNVNRINHKIIYTKYYLLIPSIFFASILFFILKFRPLFEEQFKRETFSLTMFEDKLISYRCLSPHIKHKSRSILALPSQTIFATQKYSKTKMHNLCDRNERLLRIKSKAKCSPRIVRNVSMK